MKYVETPQSRCRVGVAYEVITPPIGIYHRMWGAAKHDRSTGIHEDLSANVMFLAPLEGELTAETMRILIDLGSLFVVDKEMNAFLDHVSKAAEVPRESLTTLFTHTHAAGLMGRERESLPGGDLIPKYLDDMADKVAELVKEAREQLQPATLIYGQGRCDLGQNRNYYDEENGHYVCGFNPDGPADDTVLIASAVNDNGRRLASIVNYACHPTTLAWDNTLISPDYIGALRQTIEEAIDVPCFFIQGASGDIGPKEGYVGDPRVADRNGRQLAYAVLSALTALPEPGTRYEYVGPVISGATIGVWEHAAQPESKLAKQTRWEPSEWSTALPYREDLLNKEQLEAERDRWQAEEEAAKAENDEIKASDARAMIERQTRRLTRAEGLPAGDAFPFTTKILQLGEAIWVLINGEHHNALQVRLRERFPGTPIVVATLANGSDVWYLLTEDDYGKGLYQEEASVLAKGCLETLIAGIGDQIEKLLTPTTT